MCTLLVGIVVVRILDGGELVVKLSNEEIVGLIKEIGGKSKFNGTETFTCLEEARRFMSCIISVGGHISWSRDFVFYRKKRTKRAANLDDTGESFIVRSDKKQRRCDKTSTIITSSISNNGVRNTFQSNNLSNLCQMMDAELFPMGYMTKDARVVVEREEVVLDSLTMPSDVNKLDNASTTNSL